MARLEFTLEAQRDLEAIDSYTETTWGVAQADRYLDQIQSHCEILLKNPGLGREFHRRRPGVFRSEIGSHVVFFRSSNHGILVLRILHRRMMPENRLPEEAT